MRFSIRHLLLVTVVVPLGAVGRIFGREKLPVLHAYWEHEPGSFQALDGAKANDKARTFPG